jgi:hypothetical protein
MSQRLKLSDSQGKIYVAYKVSGQRYETSDARPEDDDNLDAVPRYELDDGRSLRHDANDGDFEIVETGERLKRVAPAT